MPDNKTKILHVTYDMNIGGTEQVIRNLVEGLGDQNYECALLCIDGHIGPWGQELKSRGVQVYCLKRKPGFDFLLIREIRRIVLNNHFDIVHCHQYTPFIYGWFSAVFSRSKIVFTEHGRFYPDVSSWKRKLINPFLQLFTAAITSISAATRKALVDYENFSAERIAVIYNGIADAAIPEVSTFRNELTIPDAAIVFGTISRLDPIKNHRMMIEAFSELASTGSEVYLLIVGDGPIRNELETLVVDLQLQKNVIFSGFQPNPKGYLAVMDIFLLPSLSEGTSMTLLEAMSFGKPSIATAVGGTPEILEHEHSGLLIQSEDKDGLVSAMLELSTSPQKRSEIGTNARASYEKRFSLKKMVDEYSKLYLRILPG